MSHALRIGGDDLRLLHDGAEALPAMRDAIASAERTVELEMYWFGHDRTGTEFRDALADAARRGVEVRLLYDALGSLGTPPEHFDSIHAAGGHVHEFAPVSPLRRRFRIDRLGFRDHRKILVVDGDLGFVGGVNLGDPWRPRADGGLGFRDDAIAVRGEAGRELRALFYESWRRFRPGDVPRDVGRLRRRPEGPVRVLTNRIRHGRRRSLRIAYLRGIRSARHRIDLANAYFVPSPHLVEALFAAARRGVEVRVLVPRESDVGLVRLATSTLVGALLEVGVRVFAYDGAVLHAKTAIFDESWGTVGSYNLDMRSWRFNLECNLAVHDAEFCRTLRASFEEDLAASSELSLAAWKQRPLVERVAGWGAYLLRQIL